MSSAPAFTISQWDAKAVEARELHAVYESTVGSVKPYSLPLQKFEQLVSAPRATVFVATSKDKHSPVLGFVLTLLIRAGSALEKTSQHDKGSIALLVVQPEQQGRGIGTKLHETATAYLTKEAQSSLSRSTPPAAKTELQVGSIFPRIFPGVPAGQEFEDAKGWFERRGWTFQQGESIDLYREIGDLAQIKEDAKRLSSKATNAGWTFRVPAEEDDQALLDLQEKEFGRFTGWPDVFPLLLRSGRREDIWCAYDPSGKVQGATVAATRGGPVHEMLAWPDTIGSACGAIACVGVSASSQGSGAGIALVATALQHLAERGADGCFVDWVSLKGFYEKCGFSKWARGYWESWKTVDGSS